MPKPQRLSSYPSHYRELLLRALKAPQRLRMSEAGAHRARQHLYSFRLALEEQASAREDLELAVLARGLSFAVKPTQHNQAVLIIERKQPDSEQIILEAMKETGT